MNPLSILNFLIDGINSSLNFFVEYGMITFPLMVYFLVELNERKEGKEFYTVRIFNKVKSKIEEWRARR